MTIQQPSYFIGDPAPIAASAPYTFFLPSREELAAVGTGDLVKLLFEYEHEIEKWGGERMWVTVEDQDGERFCGSLSNEPDEPTSPLKYGDRIEFERRQILAIVWVDPATAPEPPDYREYWERCLVDGCVLEGTEPVEYICREEPDLAEDGDEYPDSGWRIRGRQGQATDKDMEDRKIQYVAVGAVLNRDNSWLPLIDAPVGSAFMRDFETGEYVRAN